MCLIIVNVCVCVLSIITNLKHRCRPLETFNSHVQGVQFINHYDCFPLIDITLYYFRFNH